MTMNWMRWAYDTRIWFILSQNFLHPFIHNYVESNRFLEYNFVQIVVEYYIEYVYQLSDGNQDKEIEAIFIIYIKASPPFINIHIVVINFADIVSGKLLNIDNLTIHKRQTVSDQYKHENKWNDSKFTRMKKLYEANENKEKQ